MNAIPLKNGFDPKRVPATKRASNWNWNHLTFPAAHLSLMYVHINVNTGEPYPTNGIPIFNTFMGVTQAK